MNRTLRVSLLVLGLLSYLAFAALVAAYIAPVMATEFPPPPPCPWAESMPHICPPPYRDA